MMLLLTCSESQNASLQLRPPSIGQQGPQSRVFGNLTSDESTLSSQNIDTAQFCQCFVTTKIS